MNQRALGIAITAMAVSCSIREPVGAFGHMGANPMTVMP
jgi:hypothetical protein